MVQPRHLHASDLHGLAALAIHGVHATTDLVERVHQTISPVPASGAGARAGRTRGITGLVYRSIHGVTGMVGGTLDLALGSIAGRFGESASSSERLRALAVLNGVMGDHLARTGNSLALETKLLGNGCSVGLGSDQGAVVPDPGERLAVFVHGLCLDEQCWQPPAGDPERASLADALAGAGWSVVHLRYNTGRHVHEGGRDLDAILERLFQRWPIAPREVAIVGHSMGGLVARSAAHQGLAAGHDWTRCLRSLVFLGTPHHGSPLERAGHGFERLLGITRYSAPFRGIGRIRSAGITDLRHGNVLATDVGGTHRFATGRDNRRPTRLPTQTRCFAVAATRDETAGSLRSRHVGDGLVPVPSALGLHRNPELDLRIEPTRRFVATGTGHIEMLHRPEIVARVRDWLG